MAQQTSPLQNLKYHARAYYQQCISRPHLYQEKPFPSKRAALTWARGYPDCFLTEIWQGRKLLVQQSRWYGKRWKHHHTAKEVS